MKRIRLVVAVLSVVVTVHHALPAGSHEAMGDDGHSLVASLLIGCVAAVAGVSRPPRRLFDLVRRWLSRSRGVGIRIAARRPHRGATGLHPPRGPTPLVLCVSRR